MRPVTDIRSRPFGFKATALMALAMMAFLAVLSANPSLHAWIHEDDGHRHVGSSETHEHSTAADWHYDDCVVATFAKSALVVVAVVYFLFVTGTVIRFTVRWCLRLPPKEGYFLLPPLCGPPLR